MIKKRIFGITFPTEPNISLVQTPNWLSHPSYLSSEGRDQHAVPMIQS